MHLLNVILIYFKLSIIYRNDMLNSLSQMMLKCGISFRFIENKNDIGLAIVNFTNSIANRPYK